MRKVILSVLFLVVMLGLIGAAFARHKDTPQHPISISGGLTFEIPHASANRFYLSGLRRQSQESYLAQNYTMEDFLNNRVSHPLIDSTQILYDGELVADSGIMYITPPEMLSKANPKIITLIIRGNMDPKKVRGFLRRTREIPSRY